MLNNKLRSFLLIGLFGVLSGCSSSGSSNSISDVFLSAGKAISSLILNALVVFGFMFMAMLIGTFAMFKGLLRFSFAKGFGDSTFGAKEINVIALMLSIIGTTGIFFIFRDDKAGMISLFGGSVGLLFVLFICTLIMQYFLNFAKSFENPEGALGKGAGWISVVVLGAVFSLFLLVGYAGQVLKSLNCTFEASGQKALCSGLGEYNLFFIIYNNGSTILLWLIFIGLIFFFISFNKKDIDEPNGEKSSLPSISEDEKENKGKVTEVKNLMGGFSDSLSSARESAKDKEKALVELQNALRGQ
jgi:hypothetical protein